MEQEETARRDLLTTQISPNINMQILPTGLYIA